MLANHPPMHRTTKIGFNVNSAEAGNPWLRETVEILSWKLQRRRNLEEKECSRGEDGSPGMRYGRKGFTWVIT
jgi:hypothetical protein